MSKWNIMLDLETLSIRSNAAILSIGAVVFDIDDTSSLEKWLNSTDRFLKADAYASEASFYCLVNIQSCIDKRLAVDGSTIEYWLMAPEAARLAIARPGGAIHIEAAISRFILWVQELAEKYGDNICWWSHGASFDLPILQNAYIASGRGQMCNYRHMRDTRTLFALAKHAADSFDEGASALYDIRPWPRHHALYDAAWQAAKVIACYKYLASKIDA